MRIEEAVPLGEKVALLGDGRILRGARDGDGGDFRFTLKWGDERTPE